MAIGRRKLRTNLLLNTGIASSLKYIYKISNQVPSHRVSSPFAQGIQSLHTGHSVDSKSLHQSIKPLLLSELPITKEDQILTSRRRNVHQVPISKRRNIHQVPTLGRRNVHQIPTPGQQVPTSRALSAWCVSRGMRNRGLRTCIKRVRTCTRCRQKSETRGLPGYCALFLQTKQSYS